MSLGIYESIQIRPDRSKDPRYIYIYIHTYIYIYTLGVGQTKEWSLRELISETSFTPAGQNIVFGLRYIYIYIAEGSILGAGHFRVPDSLTKCLESGFAGRAVLDVSYSFFIPIIQYIYIYCDATHGWPAPRDFRFERQEKPASCPPGRGYRFRYW